MTSIWSQEAANHVNDEDLRFDDGGFGPLAYNILGTRRACQYKFKEAKQTEDAGSCPANTHLVHDIEKQLYNTEAQKLTWRRYPGLKEARYAGSGSGTPQPLAFSYLKDCGLTSIHLGQTRVDYLTLCPDSTSTTMR